MKTRQNIYGLLLLLGFGIIACTPEQPGDVNTSLDDHTPYLQHDWVLTSVVQRDFKANPGQLAKLDISDAVIAGQETTLKFDGNNYTATGIMAQAYGASGSWSLDDPNFPTRILLNDGAEDRSILLSQSILSFSENLVLEVTNVSCTDATPTVGYDYTFTKQ